MFDTKKVRTFLIANIDSHIDHSCGEANTTAMAEEAADAFDIYIDRIDYAIPEELFELAMDVADQMNAGVRL